jgi:hypothetical protein
MSYENLRQIGFNLDLLSEMHSYLTLAPDLDDILKKIRVKRAALLKLRQQIFDEIVKKQEESDRHDQETGNTGTILTDAGVADWSHARISAAVHRLLNRESLEKVAKDSGYSTEFLEEFRDNTVRHILLAVLEYSMDHPKMTFLDFVKYWASQHEVACEL